MSNRIKLHQTAPDAIKALATLSQYLETTELPKLHHELIKIRASQINGCSYCIDKHTKDVRTYGETEQRLYLLSTWREVDHFTEEERCILAMIEEITLISNHGLTEETYTQASKLFTPAYISQIIMAIITINAWNRVGVSTHMKPKVTKP